jgi:Domain of unknown function (DUF4397)
MNVTAKVLRLIRPLTVLVLSLGLLGYAGPAASAATSRPATADTVSAGAASAAPGATPGATPGSGGYLRLAHLSPNTPPVDVYLYPFGHTNAIVVLKHVAYGTVSTYQTVASGDYTVAMRLAGARPASKPVLSTAVYVAAGRAYTVAGMGPASGLRLQVINDRLSCPPGRAIVRVIQASLSQHQVTVQAAGQILSRNQPFATVTSYRMVSPGTRTMRATGPSEHATAQLTLPAGSIQTLIVIDDPGHLAVTVLRDAAGSTVTPVGGAATGFGGTAARPGGSAVPWLALAAAGLMLTLAGIARFRQIRWARRAIAHIR